MIVLWARGFKDADPRSCHLTARSDALGDVLEFLDCGEHDYLQGMETGWTKERMKKALGIED